jgi:hypothetical protein
MPLISCAAVLLALSGQMHPNPPPPPPSGDGQPASGAAAAASLPDKPIRHMEYAYSVDYQRLGNSTEGAIGGGHSGIVSQSGGGGRQGTLEVDVMAVAKDGGLVIRTAEWLQERPRASQAFLCAVYPEGRVICPDHLDVTDAENEIMTYLGRGFYDGSLVDDKGHWQRQFSNKSVAVTTDFTITGSPDANPLVIAAKGSVKSLNGLDSSWDDVTQLTYDTALSVPVSVHDVAIQHARGTSETQTTMDFKLTKDSFGH